jgi:HAE1 family hydrophobic/amphiphilic exporter-1
MSWQEALPRFSLDRRITVMVVMMTALVVGAISTAGIPLELVPRGFEAPTLTVTAGWRDAPPRDVMDKLAIPLEEELSTVRGLEQINSWSATGRVQVFMVFKQGTDMDVAYREARDRILRAKGRMPDDIEPVRILKLDSSSVPIMVLGVAVDPRVTDAYNLMQTEVVRPLQRVDGVASARSQGLLEKEVLIELDRDRTRAAGLNIYLVAQKLASDNFALASGEVRDGEQKLLLRSMARYPDVESVADQLVAPSVRIRDIGAVRYAEPEKIWRVRVNSKPALAVEVYKEGQANTIAVGEKLEAEYEKIIANPKLTSSEVGILFTQSTVIKESIGTLTDSGKIGALLAALVLFFFLRRFRLTVIIALAIPLSMVIALTAMYFAGETLNILSLLGLIISVGLLVDNSVVVAENIIRMHRDGAPRREAAIHGTSEIALAVILATLTSIVVFLPVALVEGRAQFFLLRLAMPLTVSLAASLFVALVFIPLCVYLTLPAPGAVERPAITALHRWVDGSLGAVYRAVFDRLNRMYNRGLAFFLRRRFDLVFLILVAFVATMAGPASSLEVVDVSEEDRQDFEISVDLPNNFSLEDAIDYFDRAERVLEDIRDELELEGFFTFHTARFGKIQGWFPGRDDLSRTEVTDLVMKRLPQSPGVELFTGQEDRGEQADKKSEHVVVVHGEDPEVLEEVAERIEQTATALPGVVGAKRSTELLTPNEVAVIVDRNRASRYGLSPRLVAGAIAVGLRGQPLPRLHWDGKVVPVRIRFQESDRESLAELADFGVPISTTGEEVDPSGRGGEPRRVEATIVDAAALAAVAGDEIPLSAISRTEKLTSRSGIFREDKRISRRITFDLDPEQTEEARARIDAFVAELDLPEGVRLGRRMAGNRLDEEVASLKWAALISVLFVYFLMGFLFESFVLPLSIVLTTIPLAGLGVQWSHYFAGRDLDFLGFIGLILVIGVVVNNGIVLIDYIQRLRARGVERTEAVLRAARRRFRPIMMTALSTIVGMIPLTVGAPTSIGLSYRSFGLAFIGGMAVATVLTLLVVPVFYTLFDDARVAVLRAVGLRR